MADASPVSALIIVLITIFFPPVGVFMVAGCGADLFVNVCLTLLGVIPGHVHAFYLEYIYFERRSDNGLATHAPAPGVYSDNVNTGGRTTYGTVGA